MEDILECWTSISFREGQYEWSGTGWLAYLCVGILALEQIYMLSAVSQQRHQHVCVPSSAAIWSTGGASSSE